MSDTPDGRPGLDLGEAYEILDVLGSGGMGTVYLAQDVKHDRRVAIKTIRDDFVNPEVIERFQREIQLTARLQHPRILPLLDSGVADGTLYYVMQYIEGESLEQRIAREGQLPFDEALRITRQVADALAYAHSSEIVHRDIKPANIMLAGGHALVMDFGIARAFSTGADGLTAAGSPMGTPNYMSPEQVSDATIVDGRSDIYSLGCVLYEMLAGQPPFLGNTIDSILRQQLAAEPTQIDVYRATIPESVKGILAGMLAKAPADRFQSASELVGAIETLGGPGTLPGTLTPPVGDGFWGKLRQRRLVQFGTGYAAAGWVVLEVIDQLAGNEILPGLAYPLAWVLLLSGLPGVFIVSWFHGARGQQRSPTLERWLLAAVGVVALVAGTLTVRRGVASDAPAGTAFAAVAPTEDPRRIAVTYFDSPPETEFLAAGLTEALIDELTAVDVLRVVSRNGVAAFRGLAVSPDSVGRALQVGSLVEGQVSESDSLIRVRVSLVRASDGSTVESRRLERPRAELFELQDELAAEVAQFLRSVIGEEVQLIEQRAGARDVEAWELVQRAGEVIEEADQLAELGDIEAAEGRFLRADRLLAQAESSGPSWIEPVTRRGWLAYQHARLGGLDREWNAPWLAEAMGHAERALALDAQDPDALELSGTIQYWRYLINLTERPGQEEELLEGARRDLLASTEANPRQATALTSLSHLHINQGEPAEAMIAARRSYEADPYLRNANVTLWRLIGAALDLADAVEVRKWCEEGRRRFEDDFRFRECQVWLVALPGQTPDIPQAWQNCEEVTQLSPVAAREFQSRRCHMALGLALVRAGLSDSARAVFERTRVGSDIDPTRELAMFEAMGRGWMGDFDIAFEQLALWLAANPDADQHFSPEIWWWGALHEDPRWTRLTGAN